MVASIGSSGAAPAGAARVSCPSASIRPRASATWLPAGSQIAGEGQTEVVLGKGTELGQVGMTLVAEVLGRPGVVGMEVAGRQVARGEVDVEKHGQGAMPVGEAARPCQSITAGEVARPCKSMTVGEAARPCQPMTVGEVARPCQPMTVGEAARP